MERLTRSDRIIDWPTLAAACAFVTAGSAWGGAPLERAFTYQGQIKRDGAPVTEVCAFEFRLFDAATLGTQIGSTLTFDGVDPNPPPIEVVNGLFQAALDFGADSFSGDPRFLQIGVRCPAQGGSATAASSAGGFIDLAPRQELTPAPYAILALIDETLGLPFEATIDRPEDAFLIHNLGGPALVGESSGPGGVNFFDAAVTGVAHGTATAGRFENLSGPGVIFPGPVVSIESDIGYRALDVVQKSDGIAGVFNTSGKGTALVASTTYPSENGGSAAIFRTEDDGGNESQNISATVFVGNKGRGNAGYFNTQENGQMNDVAALLATTNGAGPAFEARALGQGAAGKFAVQFPGGNNIGVEIVTTADGLALRSATSGTGSAGAFIINDPPKSQSTSTSAAVAATTSGLGPASFFEISRPENPSAAVEALTAGTGPAGEFKVANQANTSGALEGIHLSMESGPAAHLMTGGMDPSAPPLNATLRAVQLRGGTAGGSSAEFLTFGVDNDSPTVFASNSGRGKAGEFFIENIDITDTGRNEEDALGAKTLGFGRAALFEIDTAPPVENDQPAMEARTNGAGAAVVGRGLGTGPAAFFSVDNATAPPDPGPMNNATALEARTVGFGSAARFQIDRFFPGTTKDPVNSSTALHVTTNAAGPSGVFESTSPHASLDPSFKVTNQSPDTLARFEALGAQGGVGPVLHVRAMERDGVVAQFEGGSETNDQPVVDASAVGIGPAGRFSVNNPNAASNALEAIANNSRHALFAQQTGTGEAAHFEIADPGNGNIGVFIKNNGPGIALRVENQNANFAALAMGVLGKSAFNGPVDILGPTGGPVPVNITGTINVNNGNLTLTSGDLNVNNGQLCATSVCATVKNFRIDHPLDPKNKYLQHASVESSEMKNVYDGTVVLDEIGTAAVSFPDWFEALNESFRYQLTPIGAPAPNLYIAEEINDGRFSIAGGRPGMKVSWQVTGVRKDTYARAHPLQVELAKSDVAHENASEIHSVNGNLWVTLLQRFLAATAQRVMSALAHDAVTSEGDRKWHRSAEAKGMNAPCPRDSHSVSDAGTLE